ncbi:MAG TPA: VWA domain-containing protein, partial [Streptosporangiaceae bacterium]|nr:VWA domain-containing protein [Streptosporangiaceae bacterium]
RGPDDGGDGGPGGGRGAGAADGGSGGNGARGGPVPEPWTTEAAGTAGRPQHERTGAAADRAELDGAEQDGAEQERALQDGAERNGAAAPARGSVAGGAVFSVRHLQARGLGTGSGGRRSRSRGPGGRPAGSAMTAVSPDLTATVRAAALARPGQPFAVRPGDLRRWLRRGRESNLVILLLDTSGSMAARRRTATVSAVALSLLRDSYRRRDRVALLTFRGREATVVVPPTRSAGLAAQRLHGLPAGGQTPLAAGLDAARTLARREFWREPDRRPLLVVVTDGRATGGPDAVGRARHAARGLARFPGLSGVVVDAEDGPVRLGLAGVLAADLGAELVTVAGLASASPARRDDAAHVLAAIIRAKEAA